jgi:hypothetical protein
VPHRGGRRGCAALLAVSTPVQAAPLRVGQVVVAGLGSTGSPGDGGPARDARISVERIAVGADGSVYLADSERVRRPPTKREPVHQAFDDGVITLR